MSVARASLLLLLAVARCGDTRPHPQLCADGNRDSCEIACDRGDDNSCIKGAWRTLAAIDRHELGAREEQKAIAMLARACEHGSAKGCAAAAQAHDDGKSMAPLPWLDRACRAGDVPSCRDLLTSRLGEEEPADALARLCRDDVRRPPPPDWSKGRRPPPIDEPACIAAHHAAHALAATAAKACEVGDARACEKLGDTVLGEIEAFDAHHSSCIEVIASGLSPLAGALACERAGRAYERACSLRGLAQLESSRMMTCPQWLAFLGRSQRRVDPGEPPPETTLTVDADTGAEPAIAQAARSITTALRRCYAAGQPQNEAAYGRFDVRFVLDRGGRPAWVLARPVKVEGLPGGAGPCLSRALADADLGVPGDGKTFHTLKIGIFGPRAVK